MTIRELATLRIHACNEQDTNCDPGFRLKHGVEVERDYDPTIPRVFAHGSELNQVWTNLIDNAIDAMGGKGKLVIRTATELDFVLVEIIDDGPGSPRRSGRTFSSRFSQQKASAKVRGSASIWCTGSCALITARCRLTPNRAAPASKCGCRSRPNQGVRVWTSADT